MQNYILKNKFPASQWEECVPVGNGRMGISALCGVAQEQLFLNEETIWSTQGPASPNPEMPKKLAHIRQMFLDGKDAQADKLAKTYLSDCFSRIRSYESAGILKLDLHSSETCKNYMHTLNLMTGVACVEYDKDGSHYCREFFASYPDDIMVYRVTSSKAPLNVRIGYEREKVISVSSENNTLTAVAKTVFGNYHFCVKAQVVTDGRVECDDGDLVVSNTKEFCLYISIATQFRRGKDFENSIIFPNLDYEVIKRRHTEDFFSVMNRANITLPQVPEVEDLSMWDRMRIFTFNETNDNGLVMQQWQFGRYLLVSSSRPGCLPANLQGLWTKGLGNDWSCDYHTNINLQANYWPAETVGLSDCHTALFDYMNGYLLESGMNTAKECYRTRGCVVHHLSDIYNFTTPADGLWGIWPHGASWLSYHMWEHYLFTLDKEFLKNDAYEFIHQAAIFFLDNLVENSDGYLVYGPSTSPENQYQTQDENGDPYACFLTLSSAMDLGIIGGLFRNFLDASEILGIDDEDVRAIRAAKKKLPPFQISKNGNLQEWLEDYEETVKGHHHLSPAFAMYPDCAINRSTPELMAAVEQTVNSRFYGGVNPANGYGAINVGWSIGWLLCLLSRLRRAEDCIGLVYRFIMTIANEALFDVGAKCFQLDGNMAFVAGVNEMLIQSHEGVIALIPALPKAWHSGSFRGLRARGDFTLDVAWMDREVREINIMPGKSQNVIIELPASQNCVSFKDKNGKLYTADNGLLKLKLTQDIHLISVADSK